jgi:hypothetical protein
MLFRATITHTLITPDESVEDHVVWYGIESLRTRDNCRTIVHRSVDRMNSIIDCLMNINPYC